MTSEMEVTLNAKSAGKVLAIIVFMGINGAVGNDLHNIWNHLFKENTYNKLIRPVKNSTTTTEINMSVSVNAIIDFSEIRQTITLVAKLKMTWKDEFLLWDPQKFQNITHIHIPQTRIWKPYIFLENSVSKQTDFGTPSLTAVVQHDGQVEWVEVFESSCAADVRTFPFDRQTCTMYFETYGYREEEMRIQAATEYVGFNQYGGTSGWSVFDSSLETEREDFEVHVVAMFTIQRNPFYLVLNIILPIALLALLNNCVFVLPVQSGEKASFVVTMFLSLAVFLTVVGQKLPEDTETVSIMNIYVFINTLLSTIIAIVTLLQIRLYNRDPCEEVPHFLVCFARKFCRQVGGTTSYHQQKKTASNPMEELEEIQKYKHIEKVKTVEWPDVVKACDNLFLAIFLSINLSITFVMFFIAANNS